MGAIGHPRGETPDCSASLPVEVIGADEEAAGVGGYFRDDGRRVCLIYFVSHANRRNTPDCHDTPDTPHGSLLVIGMPASPNTLVVTTCQRG